MNQSDKKAKCFAAAACIETDYDRIVRWKIAIRNLTKGKDYTSLWHTLWFALMLTEYAMEARTNGNIDMAMSYESVANKQYQKLGV